MLFLLVVRATNKSIDFICYINTSIWNSHFFRPKLLPQTFNLIAFFTRTNAICDSLKFHGRAIQTRQASSVKEPLPCARRRTGKCLAGNLRQLKNNQTIIIVKTWPACPVSWPWAGWHDRRASVVVAPMGGQIPRFSSC